MLLKETKGLKKLDAHEMVKIYRQAPDKGINIDHVNIKLKQPLKSMGLKFVAR